MFSPTVTLIHNAKIYSMDMRDKNGKGGKIFSSMLVEHTDPLLGHAELYMY